MKVQAHKLKNRNFAQQWHQEALGRWNYEDFTKRKEWREDWISFDCVLYEANVEKLYFGITTFSSDIFKAFNLNTNEFEDLGYRDIADPYDAKFHRSLVSHKDGNIYAAVALLHDVDHWLDAPGSPIIRYNPKENKIEKIAIPEPHVYIQSLILDEQRDTLYGLCFPPEKLISYNLKTGESKDLGMISTGIHGMTQGQNIVLDDDGCVWSNWSITRAWQDEPSPDYDRICKYDPVQDKIIFHQSGLPRVDKKPGTASCETYFNFGDGSIYASGDNGSLYRINPQNFEIEYLFTPTPERASRLSSMVKVSDGVAYAVTGRDGKCELMKVYYQEGRFEKLGYIETEDHTSLWQCHDITMTKDGRIFICENDNPYRSSYLWEVTDY